ncbi:MAG TPA: hypothetical protein VM406_07320 [Noviherbaspirillum sp.]|nr:hypothetical protein [Noviherbaspirillum sp.]
MKRTFHGLAGAALLACAPLAVAQGAIDPTFQPTQPAPEAAAPATGGPATFATDASGASAVRQGSIAGSAHGTDRAAAARSAAEMSNDPFVQRREARAQARAEYRQRVRDAREQLREDRRAADALLHPQSGY